MHHIIPAALLLAAAPLAAQTASLDSLVTEGLRANLGLSQERLALRRARAEVAAADALRLPGLDFQARYTERSGATTDIGKLINPALGALNQLLGTPAFPTDVQLALPLKQETGFRITQPLFQPAIGAGRSAARAMYDVQDASVGASTRRLAADIQIAYLDYLKANRVAELYDSTRVLLDESVRVNEVLLKNGTATPDQVLRARAEREAVAQQQADAGRIVSALRRRVNVLLDRPVESALGILPDSALGLRLTITADSAVRLAAGRREELSQVDAAIRAGRAQGRAAGAARLPTLSAAVDYGIQGDRYRVSADRDYLLASVVLQWNLFSGGRTQARQRQASLDVDRLTVRAAEVRSQIEMEVRTAYDAASVAGRSISTAQARVDAARRTFQLVARRYGEGAATLIEYLDARTTRTNADLNLILTTYEFLQRCADLDRAAAVRTWPQFDQGARQ